MSNQELEYKENIIPMSRQELLEILRNHLREARFQHVQRVESTAIELAKQNNVNVEKASIAGLIHDYAKQRPDTDFKMVIFKKKMDPELLKYGNAIWHGIVGAEMIKDELHVWDEDILNAVRHHTTGAALMSPLEQVIYMADYIEPGRQFDGVDKARKVTKASLTDGVAFQTKQTLQYLIENDRLVYPKTIETYNAWVAGHGGKDGK